MKKLLYLLVPVIISLSVHSQENDTRCSRFRKGEFLYTDSTGITWELKRKNNIQTEKNKKTGLVLRFRIEWESDCEYTLTQLWSSDPEKRKRNGSKFNYSIISAEGNVYKYACTCNDSREPVGSVVKLDD